MLITSCTIRIVTEILTAEDTRRAVEILKRGGLVAFPTETVYGLGCDAFNELAVRRIFEVKKRPLSKPLIVGVAGTQDVYELAEVNRIAEKLMKAFFPGPLTLVLRKKSVPDIVTGGSEKVAVRMPDHDVPLSLMEKLGKPLVVPSANVTGRPSPTTYSHVIEDLGGRIDAVIVGECRVGIESTILDVTTRPAKVLRAGAIRLNELRKYTDVEYVVREQETYRTACPVYLFVGENTGKKIDEMVREAKKRGMKVVVIARKKFGRDTINIGENIEKYASHVFAAIRQAESMGAELIIVEGPPEDHEGLMERLYRLAGERVIKT